MNRSGKEAGQQRGMRNEDGCEGQFQFNCKESRESLWGTFTMRICNKLTWKQ